jgi:hypothetical protein
MAGMLLGSSSPLAAGGRLVTPMGVQGLGCGGQVMKVEGMEEEAGAALVSTEEEDMDGCEDMTGLPVVASLAAIAAAAALRRGGFAMV